MRVWADRVHFSVRLDEHGLCAAVSAPCHQSGGEAHLDRERKLNIWQHPDGALQHYDANFIDSGSAHPLGRSATDLQEPVYSTSRWFGAYLDTLTRSTSSLTS